MKVDAVLLIRLPSISSRSKASFSVARRNAVLISGAISAADAVGDQADDPAPPWWKDRRFLLLVAILLVAPVLRLFRLGRSSLWYDEVVTMRLARTESPAALIGCSARSMRPVPLSTRSSSKAWIALFGPFEYPARVFSCLCGIVTVALVYWVGLRGI